MARNTKVTAATDAVSAVRSNPYIQKAITDEELHDTVRSAIDAAKAIASQLQSSKPAAKKLTEDRLYNEMQSLAVAVRDASDSIRSAPRKQKSGFGVGRFIGLAIVGGIAALVLSESLRSKVLDALFGAEEEFQYTPTSASASTNGASAAAAPTVASAAEGGSDE